MERSKIVVPAVLVLICLLEMGVFAQSTWKMQAVSIQTRWAKEVSPTNALPEYPRPQMVRPEWQSLNGVWDYAITAKESKEPASFDGQILVPYPIESALSGVKKPLAPSQRLWYRRNIARPNLKKDERVLLHFGAVDWQASVYVNGKEVGQHQGGYQNFSLDITDSLKSGNNELVVSVWDPTDKGPNPRGKQVLNPSEIWYTATSGMWQTVWLETVPSVSIASLELTPDVDAGVLRVTVNSSKSADDYTVQVNGRSGSQVVGSVNGKPGEALQLAVSNAHLWSPADPFLYGLSVELLKKGKVVDTVSSYFGMRKIEIKKDEKGVDRIFLNNQYTYSLGVLDQGFWPDGLYTAPTDGALRFDIEAIKAMGFNTIRKHIKVEPARWYYWCDKLGMLIWQDMPQPNNDTSEAKSAFEAEVEANLKQLHNHPSIVVWVLFNYDWGTYDEERLAKWMKQLDPSRLLNGDSGGGPGSWVAADLTDIHAYPDPNIPPAEAGKARVLGEFGGIGSSIEHHEWNDVAGWGYVNKSPAELATTYEGMLKHLKLYEKDGLSGSIYTEPFDVETEENGLMTYDREVIKIPLDELRQINERLIPPTTNAGFNPTTFPVRTAAPANPNTTYQSLLEQYNNGRRDPDFVRALAMRARQEKDQADAAKLSAEYIATMKDIYTPANLEFLCTFTRSSDKYFDILHRHGDKVDEVMGKPGYAQHAVDEIITKEEIDVFAFPAGDGKPSKSEPDWDAITATVAKKYGDDYAQCNVLRTRTVWSANSNKRAEQIKSGLALLDKCGVERSWIGTNGIAWDIFQYSNDKTDLETAAKWTRLDTQQHPGDANQLNTYSNLLYKLGRTAEALESEQIAVKTARETNSPFLKDIEEDFEKMKKGEPTWPTE